LQKRDKPVEIQKTSYWALMRWKKKPGKQFLLTHHTSCDW